MSSSSDVLLFAQESLETFCRASIVTQGVGMDLSSARCIRDSPDKRSFFKF